MRQVKKIVFTGPECSGKTTVCKAAAEQLHLHWVSEYARDYLNKLNRPYEEKDLLAIAKGQTEKERLLADTHNSLILCDTSMLVMKIWSMVKYGRCHPWIEQQLKLVPPMLYFLCSPNIPWMVDPLREHPSTRNELFFFYKKELEIMKNPYILLRGKESTRLEEVVQIASFYL